MSVTQLDRELKTYEKNRDALLATAKGKWVLIKDDRIVDVFESRSDAIERGYRDLGDVPFLTKRIVEVEIPLMFTSVFVRRADSVL